MTVPAIHCLIPEAVGDGQGAANVFNAVGNHRAFGFAPFPIDATDGKELAQSYDLLSKLAPHILENQAKGRVAAVLLEDLTPSQRIRLGDFTLNVSPGGARRIFLGEPASPAARGPAPHGSFIANSPDEFYMAGSNLTHHILGRHPWTADRVTRDRGRGTLCGRPLDPWPYARWR